MLDQPYMTDLIEANSMGHEPNLIDIYSASWGPTDDGKTVDGPRNATMRAIVRGVNEASFSSIVIFLKFPSMNTVVPSGNEFYSIWTVLTNLQIQQRKITFVKLPRISGSKVKKLRLDPFYKCTIFKPYLGFKCQ